MKPTCLTVFVGILVLCATVDCEGKLDRLQSLSQVVAFDKVLLAADAKQHRYPTSKYNRNWPPAPTGKPRNLLMNEDKFGVAPAPSTHVPTASAVPPVSVPYGSDPGYFPTGVPETAPAGQEAPGFATEQGSNPYDAPGPQAEITSGPSPAP